MGYAGGQITFGKPKRHVIGMLIPPRNLVVSGHGGDASFILSLISRFGEFHGSDNERKPRFDECRKHGKKCNVCVFVESQIPH